MGRGIQYLKKTSNTRMLFFYAACIVHDTRSVFQKVCHLFRKVFLIYTLLWSVIRNIMIHDPYIQSEIVFRFFFSWNVKEIIKIHKELKSSKFSSSWILKKLRCIKKACLCTGHHKLDEYSECWIINLTNISEYSECWFRTTKTYWSDMKTRGKEHSDVSGFLK